ncbi:NUDIX domain-containing protein [Paenibacillus psychroresistens]|uniref:NUDIX domain-containing protein n=1 Tax=Paenibacillus psychroresistens TaxID=1778678 RepID=A0A6B8RFN1_9BACL|nr:NUDIX domain-containing protein [Paenibacillus psychroresistens]QGQ94302.1 NUDIX domain-containing protein [Paenibacillus psychroresistens]
MSINFCSKCGSTVEVRSIGGADRLACTSCDYIYWGNYSIGVGALIIKEGKILLVRRAQEPGKGYWTNPGGYIEQQEPIEETIVREVLEEAGIHAKVTGIIAVRDQPREIHNLYIAFEMEYLSGEPIPDDEEVDEAGFFTLEETESMNVAGFTKWLLDVAFQAEGKGLIKEPLAIKALERYGLFRV